jgi:transcriptional regulator with XRE-family HTH domain
MPKNLILKTELSRWFGSQTRFKSQREMAAAIGIPYETLTKYFKGSYSPGSENLRRLSETTGLDLSGMQKEKGAARPAEPRDTLKRVLYGSRALEDLECELARSLAALAPVRKLLLEHGDKSKGSLAKRAQIVQSLMDALERGIGQFLDDADSLVVFRQVVSGTDAGYLSGLLGAIFDDQRLQRWREMTTYRYGSK